MMGMGKPLQRRISVSSPASILSGDENDFGSKNENRKAFPDPAPPRCHPYNSVTYNKKASKYHTNQMELKKKTKVANEKLRNITSMHKMIYTN